MSVFINNSNKQQTVTLFYSKHIKTEKNPQVVKHVVKLDFMGDFWKRKKS